MICHSFWPHAVFAPAVRRVGVPLVFWTHDTPRGDRWVERLAGRTVPDLAIANSRFTLAGLPTIFPDSVPREVIRYPVEPPEPAVLTTRAEVRREFQTPEDSVVIIQSCRMDAWKGHPQLIAALGRLRDRGDWTAWFAGGAQRPVEQTYVSELQAQAQAAGVIDRIRWLGQRSDVPRLLAAADIHCQHEDEDRVPCKSARRFEQVERAARVHVEIVERARCCQIVARLGCRVDDHVRLDLLDQRQYTCPVADVQLEMREVLAGRLQALLISARIAFFAEEIAPHVIVDAEDLPAERVKIGDDFRPNQAVRASDNQFVHVP